MVKLVNMSTTAFKRYIADKNVYIFGAGRAFESAVEAYFSEGNNVRAVIDNNSSNWGEFTINDKTIEICSIEKFLEILKKNLDGNNILFISTPFYAAELLAQMDSIEMIDGMECFIEPFIRNTKEESSEFHFSKGSPQIPKHIHYIWFGGNELPKEYKDNIESWKENNPDYIISEWNESNYSTENAYFNEALRKKEYSFASNYVRIDIINRFGGIYLDTDVKVLKSLDILLNDKAFFNMGCSSRVNNGCGFGSIPNNLILEEILEMYNKLYSEGSGNVKKPGHWILNKAMEKYGFSIENRYQKINNIVLYPSEVMSPITLFNMGDCFSEKTLSVHYEQGAWKSDREKEGIQKLRLVYEERLRKG